MALKRGFLFEKVKGNKVNYSTFDLSFENKLTCRIGYLTPVFWREVVPGDKFRMSLSFFSRTAPLLFPVMHRIDVRFHWFYVPYRLLWSKWDKFRSHGNGTVKMSDQSTWQPPSIPKFDAYVLQNSDKYMDGNYGDPGHLADFLGIRPNAYPSKVGGQGNYLNVLPFVAYQRIYSDWFRNESLESPHDCATFDNDDCEFNLTGNYDDSGGAIPDDLAGEMLTIRKVNYEKDYFTSALPSPQLGEDVSLPLSGNTIPVKYTPTGVADSVKSTAGGNLGALTKFPLGSSSEFSAHNPDNSDVYPLYRNTAGTIIGPVNGGSVSTSQNISIDNSDKLSVDLSDITSVRISDLRRAFSLQRFKEILARGGTRYKEFMRSIFGVHSGDERLDRSEYLGGWSQPLKIGEVLQTSASTSESPLGDYAGRATASGSAPRASVYCPEDGIVMCCMSVVPRTGYYQGVKRDFYKNSPYDYFIPNFENIGEQEIFNRELYVASVGTQATNPDGVFGYTPRYSEYKYSNDEVHGEFTDSSFLSWHAARSFSGQPSLNSSFVRVGDYDRLFAVQDEPQFFVDIYNYIKASRPMSKYGNPW